MKVVSLVPSWTETLIEANIEVVGRTRFCIHPAEAINNITIVGGTKDCDWQKVKSLKPDVVLFDKEENLKEMADSCPVPWIATHVTKIDDLPHELMRLSQEFQNKKLQEFSQRWKEVLERPVVKCAMDNLPGVIKWIRRPGRTSSKYAYIIWKNPWMAAAENTFIGSMLNSLGFENHFKGGPTTSERYPKIDLDEIPTDVTLLFSSEPYPFEKRMPEISTEAAAIVDGEKYSWFGIRSLCFLESLRN